MTSEKSFKSISNWVQSIYKVKDKDTPVVIVGNKIDLPDHKITQDQGYAIAQDHNMQFHMTSAKTG